MTNFEEEGKNIKRLDLAKAAQAKELEENKAGDCLQTRMWGENGNFVDSSWTNTCV